MQHSCLWSRDEIAFRREDQSSCRRAAADSVAGDCHHYCELRRSSEFGGYGGKPGDG